MNGVISSGAAYGRERVVRKAKRPSKAVSFSEEVNNVLPTPGLVNLNMRLVRVVILVNSPQ